MKRKDDEDDGRVVGYPLVVGFWLSVIKSRLRELFTEQFADDDEEDE